MQRQVAFAAAIGAIGGPAGGAAEALGTFGYLSRSGGPMDFKNTMRHHGDPTELGKDGNFVYYAVGSRFFPTSVLDAGGGLYAWHAHKPASRRVGPYGIDKSAASVRDEALKGCP